MENNKDLKERTKNFALRIIKMYSSLPKTAEGKVLGTQVLRSGIQLAQTAGKLPRAGQRQSLLPKWATASRSLKRLFTGLIC
jgi:hypothetical protein